MQELGYLNIKQYVNDYTKLYETIQDYTRITETSKTKIDLIFSNFCVITEVLSAPIIGDHQIVKINVLNKDKPKIDRNKHMNR